MKEFKKLSKSIYVVKSAKGGDAAIVEFGQGSFLMDAANANGKSAIGLKGSHVPWGEKDESLLEMHQLACQNPTKWRLISTRRDFVVGKGLKVRDVTQEGDDEVLKYVPDAETKEIEGFLKNFSFNSLMRDLGLQLEFSGRYFVKLTLGLDLKPQAIELIDVFQCRPRKLEAGERKISAYVLNPNFGTKRFRRSENVELPAFDPGNPTRFAVSIIDVHEHFPGMFYNTFAIWWGTKQWTIVANKVAMFHTSGLDNGYNIKYHVSFPDNYFEKEGLNEQEQEALKEDVCNQLGESLSGVDNVNKIIITFHPVDINGKEIKGVVITPLKNEMSDNAYTQIFNTANIAQASAHGLLPTLAGIDQNQKLGGSGKELEVAANYTQYFLTWTSRQLLLQLFEYMKSIMGWSEQKRAIFQDIKIYNFDVTPVASDQNPNANEEVNPPTAP